MPASTAVPHEVVRSPVVLLTRDDAPHSDRSVRSGELVPVMRGVYTYGEAWRALAPWNRYVARVHAAALKYPDAVFTHEAGAALRGLPLFGEPTDVHVVRMPSATSREYAGVRVHTARRLPEFEDLGGLLVATPLEIATDIARSRHNAIGLAVAGAAMRMDAGVTRDGLADTNARRESSRGRRHARWVIDRATGVPESPLEQVSLAAIEWLGFPDPELQKWILGPDATDDDRMDFWWERFAVGGEADGNLKYDGPHGAAALRARSARDARLMSRGVAATAHWGMAEVRPAAQPLKAILLAAGVRPERPENALQLHSLPRALASSPARRQ